jgi:hypothetical protein
MPILLQLPSLPLKNKRVSPRRRAMPMLLPLLPLPPPLLPLPPPLLPLPPPIKDRVKSQTKRKKRALPKRRVMPMLLSLLPSPLKDREIKHPKEITYIGPRGICE